MKLYILTLFPEMVMGGLHSSITGRAMDRGLLDIEAVDIRDYTQDKDRRVDDYTYGGGAGMLMEAQPVYDAYEAVVRKAGVRPRVIYTTPKGSTFDQKTAEGLSHEDTLIILCGHYEGIDERVLDEIVTDRISIGDYVLTGGELPAMVITDTVARLIPGVLHNGDSAGTESFQEDLLEYPQYTRPEIWHGRNVPEILLSGDHAMIDKWRRAQSESITRELRPDIYERYLGAQKKADRRKELQKSIRKLEHHLAASIRGLDRQ
jgi:tRNA (guanine37-N1)-methyltransferase